MQFSESHISYVMKRTLYSKKFIFLIWTKNWAQWVYLLCAEYYQNYIFTKLKFTFLVNIFLNNYISLRKKENWQQIQKSALRTQAASGSRAKGCRARDRRPSANFLARNSRWESSPPTQCLFAGWERMTLFWLLSTAGLPRVLLGKDQKESGRAKRWKTTAGNKKKRGGWLSKMSERRRKRKRGRKRRFWWWWWCWGYNRWFLKK